MSEDALVIISLLWVDGDAPGDAVVFIVENVGGGKNYLAQRKFGSLLRLERLCPGESCENNALDYCRFQESWKVLLILLLMSYIGNIRAHHFRGEWVCTGSLGRLHTVAKGCSGVHHFVVQGSWERGSNNSVTARKRDNGEKTVINGF